MQLGGELALANSVNGVQGAFAVRSRHSTEERDQ